MITDAPQKNGSEKKLYSWIFSWECYRLLFFISHLDNYFCKSNTKSFQIKINLKFNFGF